MRTRSFTPSGLIRGWYSVLLILCCAPAYVVAQPPEAVDAPLPIRLGMSTALSGPAQFLGYHMKLGVEAAIHEANQAGGVHGRSIELVAFDDGYEPGRTAPNMRRLINEEGVVAVVGNVGTPTAVAAIPISNELRTPFYGAFTGAGVLRKTPPDRYVVNYRASYAQETASMVDALIEIAGLRPEEVAFFTQRDAYGDDGFQGGVQALVRHGLTDLSQIAHGRYSRNTIAIENALADIMQAPTPCRAVIMVGAYTPCAKFIKLAREVGLNPIFLNVSFVGAMPLANALGDDAEGVIVTQVVPSPEGKSPIIVEYREALMAIDPKAELTYGSLEGYLSTRVLLRAMSGIPGEIDRESIIAALESLGQFELGEGFLMSLDGLDHQASDRVWASVITGGSVVPFQWDQLRSSGNFMAETETDAE
ncbi:MAG: ABC transporter substrate-binding protein [Phycisphaerales bacterium]